MQVLHINLLLIILWPDVQRYLSLLQATSLPVESTTRPTASLSKDLLNHQPFTKVGLQSNEMPCLVCRRCRHLIWRQSQPVLLRGM